MTSTSFITAYLAHHGVKGQRWGVRRTKAALARAARREGRSTESLSPEAQKAKELSKKKRSELTNQELKFLNERKNLEQNYDRLNPDAISIGATKVKGILSTVGVGVAAYNTIKSPAGQAAIKAGGKAVKRILKTSGG